MKVSVYTLGCKVNLYESEYVINEFKKRGYTISSFDEVCDIYVINTCTVTNTADAKSRKIIRQAKKKNSNAIIVVMGCFSQIEKNILDCKDYADIIIGNTNKSKIVDLIEEFIKSKKQIIINEDIMKSSFDDMRISKFNTKTRAFVKVQDGCENYCTYCIIPYVRGKVRSKEKSLVIEEVKELVEKGHKEVVLTGIHTGHYGADLKDYDFSDLLNELNEIDGLERIRISSIEITELNDKFINTLDKCKKIVNHIHIPLQAGSNEILKLMNRKYDLDYYYNKIEEIRKIRPGIAITTDVIVGFPNETEELFNSTIDFVKRVNFAGGHVFPYSVRKNTPAEKMSGHLTNEIKHNRSRKLIEVFDKLEEEYYIKHIKKILTVIPEEYLDGYLIGHTENYLKVKFEGCTNLIGKEVNVKIIEYDNKLLLGKIDE